MKVLLLSDGQGWIVDRISQRMKELIPHDITIGNYIKDDPEDILGDYDLIHFNNSDIGRYVDVIPKCKTPMILTIRSFRYPQVAVQMAKYMTVHVINPDLKIHFPGSTYIADGIFEGFEPKPFKVGMAIQNTEWSKDYKGYYLVEQACRELGCEFVPALDLKPEQMREYYESVDLIVCASINEGYGTTILEAMLMNKPVLTTNVGMAKFLHVEKCERTVEGLKVGILKFFTYPQVKNFTWETVCNAITKLYEDTQR